MRTVNSLRHSKTFRRLVTACCGEGQGGSVAFPNLPEHEFARLWKGLHVLLARKDKLMAFTSAARSTGRRSRLTISVKTQRLNLANL